MGSIVCSCLERETSEFKGFHCDKPLTDAGQDLGGCKHILTGYQIEGNIPCVMCFVQTGHGEQELKHESDILRYCTRHPNIIRHIAYFDDWGGKFSRHSCLVLELVEPAGNDLFEVHVSFKSQGSMMPIGQVKHYTSQIADGLGHLNSQGIVHRDMKVENVLVNKDHEVKIIDFGLALCPSKNFIIHENALREGYYAPELTDGGADWDKIKYADLWGTGCCLYFLGTGRAMLTEEIRKWRSHKRFEKEMGSRLGKGASQFVTICDGLLKVTPSDRWSFEEVQKWAKSDEAGRKLSRSNSLVESGAILTKWPYRGGVPQCIGAKLPLAWDKKYHGQTIGDIGLFSLGMSILLVIRSGDGRDGHRSITSCPGAQTKLYRGDWIFFGVNKEKPPDDVFKEKLGLDPDAIFNVAAAKSRKVKTLVWFFPVFDVFDFKDHHANAVVGPATFAKNGENALDLRRTFELNLCGIVSPDDRVAWWPGPDSVIQKGDRGLIVRVPNFIGNDDEADAAVGGPAINHSDMKAFVSADQFYEKMGLKRGSAERKQWEAKSQVRADASSDR